MLVAYLTGFSLGVGILGLVLTAVHIGSSVRQIGSGD